MIHVLLLMLVAVTCSGVIFCDTAAIPDRKTLSGVKYKDSAGAVVGLLLWKPLPHSNLDTIALWQSFSLSYHSHLRTVTLHFKHQGDLRASTKPFDQCVADIRSLLGTDVAGKSLQKNLSLLANLQSLCEEARPKFEAHPFGNAKSPELPANDQHFPGTAGDIPLLEVENFGGQGENGFTSQCQEMFLYVHARAWREHKTVLQRPGVSHENALCFTYSLTRLYVCVTERPKAVWTFDRTRVGAYVFVKEILSVATGPFIRKATCVVHLV